MVALHVVEGSQLQDERALIAACLRREPAAERVLFRREYPRVNATVYRLVGTKHETDDLVQETFIAAFRGLAKFRGESRLSTWIDRIAVRVAFDHVRTRSRVPVPLGLAPGADEVMGGSIPDAQAHARDGLRRLYAELSRLTPEARTAFALYAIDGRSIADVAKLVGTSIVTAKLRIWRARRELMKRAAEDPVLKELL